MTEATGEVEIQHAKKKEVQLKKSADFIGSQLLDRLKHTILLVKEKGAFL